MRYAGLIARNCSGAASRRAASEARSRLHARCASVNLAHALLLARYRPQMSALGLPEELIQQSNTNHRGIRLLMLLFMTIFCPWLYVFLNMPNAIDAYDHGMNGVDSANQSHTGFACHRARNRKW
jgi:hypothetical protein